MAQIQGGPAIPVSVVTGGKIKGGKAIPVYGYTSTPTDGRRAAAGPARPVYVVSDAQMAAGTFTLEGGPALPMYVSASGLSVVGDAAQPVYVVGGSLGGAFTPASVAGLVAWYDFSDAATLFTDSARTTLVTADGNEILGVTDKSGNARHLQGLSAGNGFTYKTGIQNGKSVGLSDGVDDLLWSTFASTIAPSQFYAICVIDIVGALPANGVAISLRRSTDSNPIHTILAESSWKVRHRNDAGTLRTIDSGNTSAAVAILEYVWDGSNVDLWRNGSSIVTPASATGTTTFDVLALGGYYAPSTGVPKGAYTNANQCEFVFYSSVPSAGDRTLLRNYLNTKWAVY